jgi:Protein of unknown function (DUF4242)
MCSPRTARTFRACQKTNEAEERYAAIHGAAHLSGGAAHPHRNAGAELCRGVIERNAEEGVTWISSFISDDKTRTFCIYDAPTPEAIHKTAARNELPVDQITRVSVLDPNFYS